MLDDRPTFSESKRRSIALNAILSILGVILTVFFINYISLHHFVRLHLSPEDKSELSPMTQKVLENLTNQLNVIVLFDVKEPVYASVDSLLREYQGASEYIKVQRVDWPREPETAELVKSKYRPSLPKLDADKIFQNLIILEVEGKPVRVIYEKELSDFNVQEVVNGKETKMKRVAFKGEMLFTASIVALLEEKEKTAYFLGGHREYNFEGNETDDGYSAFASILSQNYVAIEKLNIWAEVGVPEDCSLLIIAGPKNALLEEEVRKIDEYLTRGGSLFLLLPEQGKTGLETLMKKWGVIVSEDLVFDPEFTTATHQDILIHNFNTQSAITKPLFGSTMYMPLMREIKKDDGLSQTADAPQVVELFRSGVESCQLHVNSQEQKMEKVKNVETDSFPLAVSVEKGALEGLKTGRGSTRIVVSGGAKFLSNLWIDHAVANRDFAIMSVNWLLDRTRLTGTGIGPRPISEYRLNMTVNQVRLLGWMMCFLMPGTVLGVGVIVWARKRN